MKKNILRYAARSTIAAAFLALAHRLPAPVIEESTPALEQTPTSKPKPSSKPKAKGPENLPRRPSPSATPRIEPNANTAPFAGTWKGTISQGVWGEVEYAFIVNSAGTSVIEQSRLGTDTQPAKWNGKVMTWRSGVFFKEITWTLIPNADGKTAKVACTSPFYGNPSALFHKVSD